MKGDYIEDQNMFFAKLHHHHHQHQHQHQQQQYESQHQHHQQIQEHQISEEEESQSSGGNISKKIKTVHQGNINISGGGGGGGGDGATIEVVRRPRGRPPGSKNKPKPPLIITREIDSTMRPLILELPRGLDIIEALSRFSRRRNVGISILTGSGTVANVSLHQPSTTPGGGGGATIVTFHGHFDILSISATFLPPSSSISSSSSSSPINSFTISLAGPQGQIFGGSVAGALVAAGTVFIVAASLINPTYQRLPIEDDDMLPPNSVSGDAGQQTRPTSSAGEESHPPPQAESCGMSIYSCHLPPDVIWPPTSRPTPPF